MIRAVIFDCFGVLVSEGWLPFKKRHFAHDSSLEADATDLSKQFNAGILSYSGFIERVAKLAEVSKDTVLGATQRNVPDEELFAYITSELKPKYKLGILSNAGADRLVDLLGQKRVDLFEKAALSYETGHIKPEAAAYQVIASRLSVEPAECVFIDDQEQHIRGAIQAGMQAILYTDFDQFKHDFEALLTRFE
jgi:HAD superfamily hydrolase (TIGR01549 family)